MLPESYSSQFVCQSVSLSTPDFDDPVGFTLEKSTNMNYATN